MVRAAQKGEMDNPSSEVLDAADSMKVDDVKKFAKTKHKGLPEKKKIDERFGEWKQAVKDGVIKRGVTTTGNAPKKKKKSKTKKHKWRNGNSNRNL